METISEKIADLQKRVNMLNSFDYVNQAYRNSMADSGLYAAIAGELLSLQNQAQYPTKTDKYTYPTY